MRGLTKIAAVCATAVGMMISSPLWAAVDAKTQEILSEAQSYLEKGEVNAAVIQLKNAIRDDPDNPYLRLQLARIYLSAGDALGAEKELNVALRNGIEEGVIQVPMAQTYLLLRRFEDVLSKTSVDKALPGQKAALLTAHSQAKFELGLIDEAEQLALQAVREEPSSPRATDALAVVMLRQGKLEEAESLIDTFIGAHEPDATLLFRKGEIRRGIQDHSGAISYFDRSLLINSGFIPSLTSRALSRLAIGENEKAVEDAETILTVSPQNPVGRYLKALIAFRDRKVDEANDYLVAAGAALDDYAPALFLNAAVRFARNDLEFAQDYITRFLAKVPENPNGLGVLGGIYLRRGETLRGIEVLERAERIAPEDFSVLTLLGQAYMTDGRFEEASEIFERARQINPDATAANTQYAISQLGLGNTETAVADLEALADGEDGTRALFALVTVYVRDGDYEKALAAVDRMKLEDNPIPPYFRADIKRLQGDTQSAREGFREVIEQYPDFTPVRLSLASLDVMDGDLNAAEEQLQPILKAGNDNVRAMIALARIEELRANYREAERHLRSALLREPRQSRLWLELTAMLLRSGRNEAALEAAGEFSRAFPDSANALEILVQAQLANGKQEDAAQTMGRIVRLLPRSAVAHMQHARLLMATGNLVGARQAIDRAVELDPESEQVQAMLVNVLLESEGVDAALKSIVAYSDDASPEMVDMSRADLLVRKKQYDEAIKVYSKVLETDQRAFIAARKYAAMMEAGRPDEGLSWLGEWVAAHPDDNEVRMFYGSALMGQNKLAEAAEQYVALTKSDPENPIAWNNAAWLYEEIGRPEALDLAKQAYEVAPESSAIADTYGWLLFKRGKVDESLEVMKRAYVRGSGNVEIAYHYAAVLNAAGDRQAARLYIARVMQSGAQFPERADAEALFKELNNN